MSEPSHIEHTGINPTDSDFYKSRIKLHESKALSTREALIKFSYQNWHFAYFTDASLDFQPIYEKVNGKKVMANSRIRSVVHRYTSENEAKDYSLDKETSLTTDKLMEMIAERTGTPQAELVKFLSRSKHGLTTESEN